MPVHLTGGRAARVPLAFWRRSAMIVDRHAFAPRADAGTMSRVPDSAISRRTSWCAWN
ncbi:hypothetical protein PCAR4_750056 [Paraburkholderia caribensis]|nr:hypothetical protein PCAR4_750056 [Paraburkholderia caribensis]